MSAGFRLVVWALAALASLVVITMPNRDGDDPVEDWLDGFNFKED